MSKTMKALLLKQHGDVSDLVVVNDYPVPAARPGQVVIRVGASSFNYHDVFTVKGMPGIKVPLPVIIGLDMAGEIVELGDGVNDWKIGDRVLVNPLNPGKGLMGEMLDGGMAEYCAVTAGQLIKMPPDVSFVDAASLPVAYGTAHRMLVTHNTVKKGDRVLVLGASQGVVELLEAALYQEGADSWDCSGPTGRRLRSTDAIHMLSDLFILRSIPGRVRSDNSPEFIAKAVREWISAVGAKTAYIMSGSPWENGYCESFNSKLRDELLNGEIFYTREEAKVVIEGWRHHYNTVRPHSSLGYKPPAPAAVAWPASQPGPTSTATPAIAPRPIMN